jgi:hypothetical protein
VKSASAKPNSEILAAIPILPPEENFKLIFKSKRLMAKKRKSAPNA